METTIPETTGAEPVTQTVEAARNPEVAAPEVTTTEGEETPETVTPESGETAENPDKGAHQKTLEERVQELAEKRITEVEAKLNAKLEEVTRATAEEKPNFYNIDIEKVNNHIRTTMDKIEDLKLEGNYLEAMELQDGLNALRSEIKANEQRKVEWTEKQQSMQQSQAMAEQTNQMIAKASELVMKESNITPEAWKAAEEFFNKERADKPLVDAQYREKVLTQGPVSALLWAKEYVEKNMGKKEQEATEKKEAAKTTLPPGKTSTGEVPTNAALAALREKAAASGNASDLAAYMEEKAKATAT